jgi:hypothetical protein
MSSSYCGSGVAVVERLVDWATATRVRPGERVAGDLAVLAPAPSGAIIAAVDGLGHGPAAARAARVAVREACLSAEADIATVTRRCHRVLRYTRGAALSVGLVARARRSLTWLGVATFNAGCYVPYRAAAAHRNRSYRPEACRGAISPSYHPRHSRWIAVTS